MKKIGNVMILVQMLCLSHLFCEETAQVFTRVINSKNDSIENVAVYSGGNIEAIYLMRGDAGNERYGIDIFRVLGSTVIPVEKNFILQPGSPITGSDWKVLSHRFEIPKSGTPQRYLMKLWQIRETKRVLRQEYYIVAVSPDSADLFTDSKIGVFAKSSELMERVHLAFPAAEKVEKAEGDVSETGYDVVFREISNDEELGERLERKKFCRIEVLLVPTLRGGAQVHYFEDATVALIESGDFNRTRITPSVVLLFKSLIEGGAE